MKLLALFFFIIFVNWSVQRPIPYDTNRSEGLYLFRIVNAVTGLNRTPLLFQASFSNTSISSLNQYGSITGYLDSMDGSITLSIIYYNTGSIILNANYTLQYQFSSLLVIGNYSDLASYPIGISMLNDESSPPQGTNQYNMRFVDLVPSLNHSVTAFFSGTVAPLLLGYNQTSTFYTSATFVPGTTQIIYYQVKGVNATTISQNFVPRTYASYSTFFFALEEPDASQQAIYALIQLDFLYEQTRK